MLTEKRLRRGLRGFTLIEVLTVIAIIAILAAILLPVLSKARAKSYQATCTSNLRQIFKAYKMYEQDNDGWYPPWHNMHTSSPGADYQPLVLHDALNRNYVRNDEIWFCKTAVYKTQNVIWSGVDQRYTGYLMPRVKWHYRLIGVPQGQEMDDADIPLMGDAPGRQMNGDTGGLNYVGLPHFEGQMILWGDGHVKLSIGAFKWQTQYP